MLLSASYIYHSLLELFWEGWENCGLLEKYNGTCLAITYSHPAPVDRQGQHVQQCLFLQSLFSSILGWEKLQEGKLQPPPSPGSVESCLCFRDPDSSQDCMGCSLWDWRVGLAVMGVSQVRRRGWWRGFGQEKQKVIGGGGETPEATVRQCFGVDLVVGRSSQDFAKWANLAFHAAYSSFSSIQAKRVQRGSFFSVPCCSGLLQV